MNHWFAWVPSRRLRMRALRLLKPQTLTKQFGYENRSDIRVVFTDIQMPGSIDGLKLVHAVRNRWPPIRIIVTSGHGRVSEQDLPEGGRFFAKPYDSTQITETIREWTR